MAYKHRLQVNLYLFNRCSLCGVAKKITVTIVTFGKVVHMKDFMP